MKRCLYIALIFLLIPTFALSHDHNRTDLDSWYSSLHARNGSPCCGGPKEDATQLEDLEWTTEGDHYKVHLGSRWVDVPKDTVVEGPNLAGRALVWLYYINGEAFIRCFKPGIMG